MSRRGWRDGGRGGYLGVFAGCEGVQTLLPGGLRDAPQCVPPRLIVHAAIGRTLARGELVCQVIIQRHLRASTAGEHLASTARSPAIHWMSIGRPLGFGTFTGQRDSLTADPAGMGVPWIEHTGESACVPRRRCVGRIPAECSQTSATRCASRPRPGQGATWEAHTGSTAQTLLSSCQCQLIVHHDTIRPCDVGTAPESKALTGMPTSCEHGGQLRWGEYMTVRRRWDRASCRKAWGADGEVRGAGRASHRVLLDDG